MKKIRLYPILLIAGLVLPAIASAAEKVITKTTITGVTLYPSGAMVYRTASTAIEAGLTEIRFVNLSPQINPASISVSASGECMVMSVTHQLDYLGPDFKSNETRTLEDSLEKVQTKYDLNQYSIESLQEEFNVLMANKVVGGSNTGLKLEDLKNVAAFVNKRSLEIKTRIMELNAANTKLKINIDKIKNQLAISNAGMNQPHSTIKVTVNANASTSANFKVSYFTNNVSWQPQYEIRVADVKNPVKLIYKANVSQNTGEDWHQVKLRLSTGNPVLGISKPELSPWYLNFLAESMRRKSDFKPESKQMELPISMAPGVVELSATNTGQTYMWDMVSVTENQLTTDYEINVPYTILSDNQISSVDIQQYTLPATYSYYAVPSLDKDAFLMASITDWTQYDLLPASANVYFENGFVGETSIQPSITSDTLLVSLGRDTRIAIERKLVSDKGGNQVLGGNRIRKFNYETTVKNNRKEPVNIHIEDQIPVSRDKEIEVTTDELSGGELNADNGKVIWKADIAPGQQLKKSIRYGVKYPKDRRVNGL